MGIWWDLLNGWFVYFECYWVYIIFMLYGIFLFFLGKVCRCEDSLLFGYRLKDVMFFFWRFFVGFS